jgi:hypothetical protein
MVNNEIGRKNNRLFSNFSAAKKQTYTGIGKMILPMEGRSVRCMEGNCLIKNVTKSNEKAREHNPRTHQCECKKTGKKSASTPPLICRNFRERSTGKPNFLCNR